MILVKNEKGTHRQSSRQGRRGRSSGRMALSGRYDSCSPLAFIASIISGNRGDIPSSREMWLVGGRIFAESHVSVDPEYLHTLSVNPGPRDVQLRLKTYHVLDRKLWNGVVDFRQLFGQFLNKRMPVFLGLSEDLDIAHKASDLCILE